MEINDLPHIGYTCNRNTTENKKDTYNIMTGVQFTNLFTMTGTRSIKYHFIQLYNKYNNDHMPSSVILCQRGSFRTLWDSHEERDRVTKEERLIQGRE